VTDESLGTTGCVDGYKIHKYDAAGVCERCGYTAKGKRPTTTNRTYTKKQETSFSRQEAKEGISMLLLASQSVILAARPDLKEDALNAQERMLLSDALADEAFESKVVHKYLAKLGQQKKHTKLMMVCMAIAIPRLARRGIIPQEGMGELQDELISQASTSTRPGRDTATGSEPEWTAVPVESGGSPIPNRGNGIGENDIGGIPTETTPLRSSTTDENGRSEFSNGSGGEVASSDEESPLESYRTKTRPYTRRSKAR
jgi:hypothetical protein